MKIPKNSVGTKQLKTEAVTSKKVKDGTLKAGDLAPGVIPAPTTIEAYRFEREIGSLALGNAPAVIFSTGTLPAGSYVLTSRVNLRTADVSPPGKIICSIENDAAQNFTIDTGTGIALSQTATVTLDAPRAVDLYCFKNSTPGAIVYAEQTTITAQKVTSITTG